MDAPSADMTSKLPSCIRLASMSARCRLAALPVCCKAERARLSRSSARVLAVVQRSREPLDASGVGQAVGLRQTDRRRGVDGRHAHAILLAHQPDRPTPFNTNPRIRPSPRANSHGHASRAKAKADAVGSLVGRYMLALLHSSSRKPPDRLRLGSVRREDTRHSRRSPRRPTASSPRPLWLSAASERQWERATRLAASSRPQRPCFYRARRISNKPKSLPQYSAGSSSSRIL
jgi:hypothetical protein